MTVASVEIAAPASAPAARGASAEPAPAGDRRAELKEKALAEPNVQALLDVFAAEIKDVEELK
jgi:hypothetical protein